MHHILASSIPMAERLPHLRAYLRQAQRMISDPATPERARVRLRSRITRIEADLLDAASKED